MKKILIFALLSTGFLSFGQIGIGTPNPRGALDINKPTTNDMGLVLPTNSDVNNIHNPLGGNVIPGTMIYDSTNDCVRFYKGDNTWNDCSDSSGTTSLVLNCAGATHNGTLRSGANAPGVSTVISYTGGNGSSHNGQVINSANVTGLTATLSAGSFANGSGTLTYIITGTPTTSGIAYFSVNIGGQTCLFTREVLAGAGTIINLNCSDASYTGSLSTNVPTTGATSIISYTGGNGGSHNGQTVNSTGVTGLTATLAPGNFANGNGTLTYIISGTPSTWGTASFAINIGGKTCTLTRSVTQHTSYTCIQNGWFITKDPTVSVYCEYGAAGPPVKYKVLYNQCENGRKVNPLSPAQCIPF